MIYSMFYMFCIVNLILYTLHSTPYTLYIPAHILALITAQAVQQGNNLTSNSAAVFIQTM